MPVMRDIKRRIKSISSIRQITRAMKMVAAAKLNRAQNRMLSMRPYAYDIERILLRILPEMGVADHPLLMDHEDPKKIGLLVISSDRGLCAGFNTNLAKKVESFKREHPGSDIKYLTIGAKIDRYIARSGAERIESYTGVIGDLEYGLADRIAEKINAAFSGRDIEALYLVYNEFKSVMSQNLVVKKILPFNIASLKSLIPQDERAGAAPSSDVFEYEPEDTTELADLALPRYLSTMIFRALLESYASELSARMIAMGNATKNAGDMIQSLTLTFNKARQSAITTEIIEIVSGAEALKG